MALERRTKFTVPADTAVVHHLYPNTPTTVGVSPGVGGTVVVAVQIVRDGAWRAAGGDLAGTLSAAAADVLLGPAYALRFTAATANATIEVSQ